MTHNFVTSFVNQCFHLAGQPDSTENADGNANGSDEDWNNQDKGIKIVSIN